MIVVYIVLTLLFVLIMSVLISDSIKFHKQFKKRKDEINKTHHKQFIS
jgi:hypothetical protein